jgi:hypothetical protein
VEGQSPEEEERQRKKKPRSSPEEAQKKPNQAQAEEAMGGMAIIKPSWPWPQIPLCGMRSSVMAS